MHSRHLPVVALHLAAQTAQRVVRGHQVRLLVSYATSNEPALRHRAPKACRAAAVAAAERLKQRRPRIPKPARAEGGAPAEEGQLDASEVGLISRYLEAKMRRNPNPNPSPHPSPSPSPSPSPHPSPHPNPHPHLSPSP